MYHITPYHWTDTAVQILAWYWTKLLSVLYCSAALLICDLCATVTSYALGSSTLTQHLAMRWCTSKDELRQYSNVDTYKHT